MLRGKVARGGILFALIASATLSCGERTPTEPNLPSTIVAVPSPETFLNSPQHEARELLIDGRPTEIEWDVTGDPIVVLLRGNGGDYFASIRALWSYNPLDADSVALYLMLQYGDPTEEMLERPLITSVDWRDADGDLLVDCEVDNALVRAENWRRDDRIREDQVQVEIYSDAEGGFPADMWRWGAATTNLAIPVNPTEYPGADSFETYQSTLHPLGAFAEDFYNTGSGWVRDAGIVSYEDNFLPGSAVPRFIASKSTRDVRLNRGKPVSALVWRYVAKELEPCDSLNPVRLDDASLRDKTWNPGDYVPSHILGIPTGSQTDALARGTWENGKWSLEMRRLLEARPVLVGQGRQPPRPDDVILHTGRTYGIRFRIFRGSSDLSSATPILPLYIKPRS
jgi:hypothetical protein